LQIVRRQRRTESAAAIEHDLGVLVGRCLFDVALDDPAAEMFGAGGMVLALFVIFAHVDEPERLARVELPFDLVDGNFADTRSGVLAEFFKSFRMLHHYSSENPWERHE
jgi:hypothetical protein